MCFKKISVLIVKSIFLRMLNILNFFYKSILKIAHIKFLENRKSSVFKNVFDASIQNTLKINCGYFKYLSCI